jgi:hypothetical protein
MTAIGFDRLPLVLNEACNVHQKPSAIDDICFARVRTLQRDFVPRGQK